MLAEYWQITFSPKAEDQIWEEECNSAFLEGFKRHLSGDIHDIARIYKGRGVQIATQISDFEPVCCGPQIKILRSYR